MNILGIHDGHNACAALVVDGCVVAALQEERPRMEKNWSGFPTQAIEAVLRLGGLGLHDLDMLAYNGHHIPPAFSREADLEARARNTTFYGRLLQTARRTPIMHYYKRQRREQRLAQAEALGLPRAKIRFTEHHTAHAAAAYYGWGVYDEPILVLTADGAGDELSATVSIGEKGRLRRIASIGRDESLGAIYSAVTFLMGMVPLEHEYKLMGLAPYADPQRARVVADALLRYMPPPEGLTWRRAKRQPPTPLIYQWLKTTLERQRFDSIAAGVQLYTEEMLLAWVKNAVKLTGIRKLALSGGVFMNVKANQRILELPEVESVFIFPSCGDESNAMGAAFWQEAEQGRTRYLPPIEAIYWGPDFEAQETTQAVEKRAGQQGWRVEYFPDPAALDLRIAEMLAEGHIVARARGRMEFGARALGNRSILADPTLPKVVDTINYMVKQRDFWMPFAPMVLDRRAEDYLVNPKAARAPYMILTFETRPAKRAEFPAALHPYDQTARPQIVEEAHNPALYRLLSHFEALTGRGVLLNTSFNLHGWPIVGTPDAALDVFEKSGLPHLALGDWLVSKPDEKGLV